MTGQRKTCRNCARFKIPDSGCTYPRDIAQGLMTADSTACDDFYPKPKEKKKKRQMGGEYFDDHGKFIPKLLADDIMSREHFITLIGSKEIYVWRDGFYQAIGEVVIEQHCKNLLENEFRKNRFGEAAEYIRASTFTNLDEPSGNLINVENGVLNVETGLLEPHDPKYCFFNKMNVKYDPECEGKRVHSFLREVTGSEEDAKTLEEILGYCLYRHYPYHKALALAGEGANGKSTFLALVKEFLGRENVSGKSLVELELNRFAKASLFGKLANIYADLSDDTLQRTGTFKMLTGGDMIEAEKKFRDSFTFVNYAKLLFSCNKLPQVYDDTDAFFRRWTIVVFPKVFTGDNCDPNIIEKLTVPEELSSLLNIALEGLKRVLENDGFSYGKSTEEIREDYIRKSDPLAAFAMDCIEESQHSIMLKQQLYSLFAFYCRENNLPAVNKDTFFKNISKHVTVTQVRVNRKDVPGRPYGFKGIALTELGKELWSKQSNQSGVSDILMKPEDRDAGDNKIGKPMDSLDWSDHKLQVVSETNSPSVQEAIEYALEMMVKRLPSKSTGDDFLHSLQFKGLSKEEAEKVFAKLIEEGFLGYNADGWLVKP